jgi:hypothetical protein
MEMLFCFATILSIIFFIGFLSLAHSIGQYTEAKRNGTAARANELYPSAVIAFIGLALYIVIVMVRDYSGVE